MTKKITKKSVATLSNDTFTLFPEKYRDLIFIGLIVLSVFVFFWGVITSHELAASDNFASISFRNYLDEASKNGDFPHWVPYIFSGMPGFSSFLLTGDRLWDVTSSVFFGYTRLMGDVFGNDSVRVMQFYVIFGIGMYLLMRSKNHMHAIAFFVAIAALYSTGIIHWIMIGHNTKPITMALLPYIFMLMEKVREKFSILYATLLVISIHLIFESTHVQMIFYSGIAIGVYVLFELISRFITKRDPIGMVKLIGVLVVAGGFAFLMSSDRYLSIQEYTPYSTRGASPITQTDGIAQADDGGNTYEYATMWSFSPQEITTFFVPNYYGFGKLPYSGPATGGEEFKVPTYWGQKVFEDVAPYMGIIVVFLAIAGFVIYRKDAFVQTLMAISLFMLLLSFGNNLSILYDFFFYNVPSFNKFRAPSMALAIMQFAFPILAGYGLTGLVQYRRENSPEGKKIMNYILISAGAFLVLGLFYAAAMKSFYIDAVTNTANQSFKSVMQQIPDLPDFVWSNMIGDWLMNGFIYAAFAALAFLFVKGRLKTNMFFISIILLLFIDLWRVGLRPLDITETDQVGEALKATDVVDFIKQDAEKFRIADFAMASISPNLPAYFKLENVGGYHPAKLRVYQDLLDVADEGSTNQVTNPFLWNMMNVKYLITPKPYGQVQPAFQSGQTGWYVYFNPSYLPRAFFVDSAAVAKPMDILRNMKEANFNPLRVAYFEEDHKISIEPATEEATAQFVSQTNDMIKFKVKATGNNLLFISETYYPFWKAFIGDKELPIYKTNYAFRSVLVPPGEHEIVFNLTAPAFEQGKTYSMISNILILALLAVGIFLNQREKKQLQSVNEE
ncbi:MAG: YfhO family protein [Candidatus Kapabacteria bacterium]|nr:YfhO family protein [Candidatus Kapabacteria bacterium]